MTEPDAPPTTPRVRPRSSGWAWFFAGTTLALAVTLGGLLWALTSTGLYPELIARLGPTARRVVARPEVLRGPSARALAIAPTATAASAATGSPAPPAAGSTPAAAGPTAASARAGGSQPARSARLGEVVESGPWKLLVNSSRAESTAGGRRLTVDFTIKNDQDRSASLAIPATIPMAPRSRPAGLEPDDRSRMRPVQLAEPPALRLSVLDRGAQPFGGAFVAANRQTSGSYTFEAAPRDAIRLTYAFELPASAAEPLSLDASFGVEAGGQRARVALDATAEPVQTLAPSDPPRSAGKDERLQIGSLWAVTARGVEVGEAAADGGRTVTASLRVENLADQPMVVGATLDDPTGAARDFYVVDAEGRLAYSSADSLPRTVVAARQTRDVEVRMKGGSDFATAGAYRLSVVVDARRDRYGVFRLP